LRGLSGEQCFSRVGALAEMVVLPPLLAGFQMARSPDGPDTGSVSGRLIAVVFFVLLAATLWLAQRGSEPQSSWPSSPQWTDEDSVSRPEPNAAPPGAVLKGAGVTPRAGVTLGAAVTPSAAVTPRAAVTLGAAVTLSEASRTILLPETSTRGAAAREAQGSLQPGRGRPTAKLWPGGQGSSSRLQAKASGGQNLRAQAGTRRGR
jgi:hypothetical protein